VSSFRSQSVEFQGVEFQSVEFQSVEFEGVECEGVEFEGDEFEGDEFDLAREALTPKVFTSLSPGLLQPWEWSFIYAVANPERVG
jgi:hypothetical protein